MAEPFNNIKTYWYIDEKGILSLVSQCEKYLEEERKIEKSKSTGRKAGLQLAIKAIAAIFGSASANTNIEQSISSGQQETYRLSIKTEQHLNKLIDYLKDRNQLFFYDKIDTFLKIEENKLPLFCIANFQFYLDTEYYFERREPNLQLFAKHGFGLNNEIVESIKKEKFILFKADIEQQLLKFSQWQRVVMGASLAKWPSVRIDDVGNPDFGRTSHLAFILCEGVNKPISIKFLGHVTKMGTSLYIKPYAIWDIS